MTQKLTIIIQSDNLKLLEDIVPSLENLMWDIDKNAVSILRFGTIDTAAEAVRKAKAAGKKVEVFTTETAWPLTESTRDLGVEVHGTPSISAITFGVKTLLYTAPRKKKKKK